MAEPRLAIVHERLTEVAGAMRSFDPECVDRAKIRARAEGFSRADFRHKMREVVDAAL